MWVFYLEEAREPENNRNGVYALTKWSKLN